MPPKNGFRLKDAEDVSELICRLMRSSHDPGGQYCQGHFLNTAGSDTAIEFALQDRELLSKKKDFKVFLQVG